MISKAISIDAELQAALSLAPNYSLASGARVAAKIRKKGGNVNATSLNHYLAPCNQGGLGYGRYISRLVWYVSEGYYISDS